MAEALSQPVSFYQAKTGLFSWIFSTDHKRIGLLYFYAIISFFLVAMSLGFLMRLELIAPGETIMDAKTYNQVFTLHGVIMIFIPHSQCAGIFWQFSIAADDRNG